MTTFTGQPGQNDTFTGGSGADTFVFSVADLDGGDRLAGGGGLDTLLLSGTGSLTAARLSGLSSIEAIVLANGGIGLAVDNAVATALGGQVTITGSAGDDLLDWSAVTLANRSINVTAGGGLDTFRGGAGFDTFRFNAADLNGDTVDGGASTDVLYIETAGAVNAAALANVRAVERFALAAGGNVVTLNANNILGIASGTLQIVGNAGNDTINAAAIAGGVNKVDITAGGGLDVILGSAGGDTFRFNAGELANDQVNGASGADGIIISGQDDLTAADIARVSNIERITFTAAGSSITLDNVFAGQNASSLTINGTAGNDRVDASAVTLTNRGLLVFAGTGSDVLLGGLAPDVFRFNAGELDGSDVVNGGGGSFADTLTILTPTTIAAADLAGVSGIERVTLAQGTNSVTLTDAMVQSANNKLLTVYANIGNDTIDASAVSSTGRVEILAGGGNDRLTGGAGNDQFRFSTVALDGNDVVAGGAGTDQLILSGTGTLIAARLAGVSGIESLVLATGGVSATLDTGFAQRNGPALTVFGSAGNDAVDASGNTDTTRSLIVNAGAGNDSFRGGAGNDTFRFNAADFDAADTVAGGAGSDTLAFTTAGAIAAASLANTTGIETISLTAGSSLALDNAALAGNAAVLAILGTAGNDAIDASANTLSARAISVTAGLGDDTLRGGAGEDSFVFAAGALTGADIVEGGAGAALDTLRFTTAGTFGSATFAGVSGIERIQLAAGTNSVTLTAAMAASADARTLRVIGAGGNDAVNGAALDGSSRLDVAAGAGDDQLIGGAGADVFRFQIANFTAADQVAGGDGVDGIAFSGSGTIDFTQADNVSGVEALAFDNGAHTIVLSDELVQSAGGTSLTLATGSDVDVIDVSRVSGNGSSVTVNTGDGDDVVIDSSYYTGGGVGSGLLSGDLGGGNDTLRAWVAGLDPVTLSGGAGTDTIEVDVYGTGGVFAMGAGITGFERVDIVDSSGFGYGYTGGVAANDTAGLVVTGVSTNTYYNLRLGNGGQTATGNNYADQILGGTGADTLTGNAGEDTLDGGGGADVVDGGADNDRIRYRAGATSLAGGAGTGDWLHALDGGSFDLSAADQSLNDTVQTTGFENVEGYYFDSLDGRIYSSAALTVKGSSGVNTIGGSDYDDVIDGNGGADLLVGNNGADRITYRGSEAGIHAYFEGGYSDVNQGDTLVLRTAATIRLANTDQTSSDATTVTGFQHVDGSNVLTALSMQGSAYGNILTGGAANDTLSGLDGDDTLDGGGGVDTLVGGNGNDRIWYDAADSSVNGGADIDTLLVRTAANINLGIGDQSVDSTGAMSGFEHVDASAASASVTLRGSNGVVSNLTGGSANDSITAGPLGAVIAGGGGADTLTGSAAADTFVYRAGDVVAGETLAAGGGSDVALVRGDVDFSVSTITGLERMEIDTYDPLTGYGTQGINVTLSGAQAQAIGDLRFNPAGGGADTFTINVAANGTASLAAVTFSWMGDEDRVLLNGASGNETITGGNVAMTVHGNGGNDTLIAADRYWRENSAVYGDAGNDRVDYGYGPYAVTLDGGADSDTLVGSYTGGGYDNLVIDLALADQTVNDGTNVANFENVDWSGLGYGLTVRGGAGVNTLIGSSAADVIDGRAGADTLAGGGGDDRIVYDADDVSVQGGADNDTLVVIGAANINLSLSDQSVGATTGTMGGFENVDASASSASVTLRGSNTISSVLTGGSANDTINAGSAGATITGGAGADTLTGSSASDTFLYRTGDVVAGEVLNAGGGYDFATLRGSADFTGTTITGLESLRLDGYDSATGTYDTQAYNLTLTGAQAEGLSDIFSRTDGYGGADTLTINVASGTTVSLYALSLNSFGAEDAILVNGTGGNETITGVNVAATIHGRAGNDTLLAPDQYWREGAVVFGDEGNDRIDLGYAPYAVTLDGGADIDTLVGSYNGYAYDGVTIDLALADQTTGDATTVSNFENVDWSALAYAMRFGGNAGVNAITGGGGDDWIDGRAGADTLAGGDGQDTIVYDGADAIVAGGAGYDTLLVRGAANIDLGNVSDQSSGDLAVLTGFEVVNAAGSQAAVTLRGRDDDITTLIGGAASDSITGGAGGADITGGGGADTLVGGSADDTFRIDAGHFVAGESIDGGGGTDYITLTASADFTIGTLANVEVLRLGLAYDPVSDTSSGPAASITLTGTQAAALETVYGWNEADDNTQTKQTFTINVASGTTVVLGATNWVSLSSWDEVNVNGAAGNETINGPNARGTIHGFGGNDWLRAPGDWHDGTKVYGDAGDDRIDLGSQNRVVTIDGGADNDTLVGVADGYNGFAVDLSLADQTVGDSATVTGFENADWSIVGGGVTITGSAGANRLTGSRGDDTLRGGNGADVLTGGEGSDTLTGGSGADTFRFEARDGYSDTITDFLSVDDTLQFAAGAYDYNGAAFDTVRSDSTGTASLAGADLIRYLGGSLSDTNDVVNYLRSNATGSAGEGAFVIGRNASGQTMLFHTVDASATQSFDVVLVANLGSLSPNSLQVSDFSFV